MQFTKVLAPLALSTLALASTSSVETTSTALRSEQHTTLVTITSCGTKDCTETVSVAIATTVTTSTEPDEVVTMTTTPAKHASSSNDEVTYVDVTTTPTVTVQTAASTDVTVTPTLYTTYNSNYTVAAVSQFAGAANQLRGTGLVAAVGAVGAYLLI